MAKTIKNVLVGVATLEFKCPIGGVYTEVGYTEDGVIIEYEATAEDVNVEEETFPLARLITKERLSVKCNMAEASLANLDKAIAGSILAGSVITIGNGLQKEMSIRIAGINPDGFARTIEIPLATAVGAVGHPYRKGLKSIVPVEFQALKGSGDVCTITDSTS